MTNSEILIYQFSTGKIKIDVRLEDDTVWLTQSQIALLFNKGRTTITEHIQNIFKEGELEENSVCRNFRHTTQHGVIHRKRTMKFTEEKLEHFNLETVICKPPNGYVLRTGKQNITMHS